MMVENYNNYSENYMILSLIQCGQPKHSYYIGCMLYTLYMYIICCVGFKAVQIILKCNEVIVHTCSQDRMQRAGDDHMTVM